MIRAFIIIAIFLTLNTNKIISQDTIILKNNTEILSWISGFDQEYILYSPWQKNDTAIIKMNLDAIGIIKFCRDFPYRFTADIRFKNNFILQTDILYYKDKLLYYYYNANDKRINHLELNDVEKVISVNDKRGTYLEINQKGIKVNKILNTERKKSKKISKKPNNSSQKRETNSIQKNKSGNSKKPTKKIKNNIANKNPIEELKNLNLGEKFEFSVGVLIFSDMLNNRFSGFDIGVKFAKYSRFAAGYSYYNGASFPYFSYKFYFEFINTKWTPYTGIIYPLEKYYHTTNSNVSIQNNEEKLNYNIQIGAKYGDKTGINFCIFTGYSALSKDSKQKSYNPVLGFNVSKSF